MFIQKLLIEIVKNRSVIALVTIFTNIWLIYTNSWFNSTNSVGIGQYSNF